MKNKKIIMIIILVAFIIAIGVAVKIVNDKSNENADSIVAKETTNIQGNEDSNANSGEIIEITDNYFIEQTNDVYLNLKDYLGKTIKMQGLVYSYDDGQGNIYHAVVRNTPGCCGNDGLAGIDVKYDGKYPDINTWVEVVGTVESYKVYNMDTPVLKITSINETETGTKFVSN